ncbi:MAG: methyltransferase [Cyanophyceae cyanobacterium]
MANATQDLNRPNPDDFNPSEPAASQGWNQRYKDQDTGWDLGQPSPVLAAFLPEYLKQHNFLVRSPNASSKAAVVGCGRGHDARFIAKLGIETVGFDFAPLAIKEARELAARSQLTEKQLRFEQMDIFAVAPQWQGQFDLIIEHTCFCAINPEQRPDYVESMRSLLKPEGILVGVFFTHNRPGGPPFGTNETAVLDVFSPRFKRESWQLSDHSIGRRKGDEHVGVFRAIA